VKTEDGEDDGPRRAPVLVVHDSDLRGARLSCAALACLARAQS
jgi:hypothetical protein